VHAVLVRDLTVLLPAYNEARRIEGTLDKVLAWLPSRVERYEVLVVDDGSSDGTAEVVERRYGSRVRVVKRSRRGGKGAAIKSGVMAAKGEWILFSDADFSIPIDELEKLAARTAEAPIVIGSKRAPGSDLEYPKLRNLLGQAGNLLVSTCVVSGFHDTQCGFKLYRADVARELFAHQRLEGFGFDFEVLMLARRMGHAVVEVPIRCAHKIGGSVRLSTYLAVLREVGMVLANKLLGRYPRRR
jgi:dolichyl-phosphate beta-glucosyltransferase